jgi:hypothetical protein
MSSVFTMLKIFYSGHFHLLPPCLNMTDERSPATGAQSVRPFFVDVPRLGPTKNSAHHGVFAAQWSSRQ